MPNRQGPGFIEEMMNSAQHSNMPPQMGMPLQGGPSPTLTPKSGNQSGVAMGPMGPERMVPGAIMIVELNGMFYLVPSIDEQGRPMDDATAVLHLQQTGLFFASSTDPQLLVSYVEQAMSGGKQPSGKKQAGGTMPPM